MLDQLIPELQQPRDLRAAEVAGVVASLMDPEVPTETKADFLTALAEKGETADEITAFALEFRHLARRFPIDPQMLEGIVLDVCGTGGDRQGTFNISTTSALLIASAGVAVAKHGNRAITSKSGSADVLEALGFNVELSPEAAARCLKQSGFCFLFAPHYHPGFKAIAPTRKLCAERGQRTVFNLLGPLLNPARPNAQLIGVPRPEWCEPIGHALQSLGVRRGMVVSGTIDGVSIDELSPSGETTIAEFYQDRGFHVSTLSSENFPLRPTRLEDLAGGDAQTNAAITREILSGTDTGPRRDAVLLNAAAGLLVAGRARNLVEGWNIAASLIINGTAARTLESLVRAHQ